MRAPIGPSKKSASSNKAPLKIDEKTGQKSKPKPPGGKKRKAEPHRVRRYRKAFRDGDPDVIAADSGKVAGHLVERFLDMMEIVVEDGMVLRCPKVSIHGEPIMVGGVPIEEVKAHPLLDPMMKVAKLLGIDFNEFLLTPKSKKAQREAAVQGKITNNTQYDIKVVMVQQEELMSKFAQQVEAAKELRGSDPVYQKYATPEDKELLDKVKAQLDAVDKRKD